MEKDLHASPIPYLTIEYLLDLYRDYASPQHKVKGLTDNGEIIHIKQGLYLLGKDYQRNYSREVLSGMIYGPSAISFEYALAHHGLIPERVETITCLCFKRDKIFKTPVGAFTYKYISKKLYAPGLNYHQTELGNYFMASPEKAICDIVYFQKNKSLKEAKAYLLEELRIYENEIQNLDSTRLLELTRWYKRESVQVTVDAIIEIKKAT